MRFTFDTSALDRLTADFGDLPDHVHENIRKIVEHTAGGIGKAWNRRLYSEGSAKLTGKAIDYTVTEGVLGVAADIGARAGRGRQAGVVRLLENGSIHNAPHGSGAASLEESVHDFEDRVAFAGWAATRDTGIA